MSSLLVSNEKFTLEVEGTVGTEIKVRSAAKVYSYTPSESTKVRFVGKNSKVYVYEGGTYKGVATEADIDASYPEITDENVAESEDNLLTDASFENHGEEYASGKYYLGSSWETNLKLEETNPSIRIATNENAKNGTFVFMWRGSGNSNYFSQKLSSLKPNTTYKIQMSQVTSSNANANFNVGFGSKAGDLSLGSTIVRLGTNQNGVKEVIVTTPTEIADGDVYFTLKNTAENTASSGNDPLTQLDWISVVEGTSAKGIDGATSAVYVADAAYAPEEVKYVSGAIYTEAIVNPSFETGSLAPWEANSANDTGVKPNSNATYTVSNADGDYVFNTWGGNGAKYIKQKLTDLPNGYYTVTALVASDAGQVITLYAGDQVKGAAASSEGKGVGAESTTTKAKVTDGTLEIGATSTGWYKVDNFRLTYYSQEAVDQEELEANKEALKDCNYSTPSEDLLVNGNCDEANNGWNLTNMKYQQNNERPTRYIETWTGDRLSGNYSASQTVRNMPAGVYVLKGTFNAEKQNSLEDIIGVTLNLNDKSINISTPGGKMWRDYELFCNIETDGDLNIALNINGSNANWVAMDDLSLKYYGSYAEYLKAKYTDVKANATETLNSEDYTIVAGSERTALTAKINAAEPTTDAAYETAIEELNAALIDFTGAKPAYAALKKAQDALTLTELPYASAAKYTELANAKAATATSKEDATTKLSALTASQRAYIESNGKAEGVEGAVDCTDKVINANFADKLNGWESTQTGGNLQTLSGETWTNADGTKGGAYYDYNNGSANNQHGYQIVEGLTTGKYIVTIKARAQAGFNLFLLINDEKKVDIEEVGNSGNIFDRGWNDYTTEFTVGNDGKVKLEVANMPEANQAGWFGFGDVRLYRIGDLDAVELDEATANTIEDKTADVTLKRTLTTNWNTIVLPFALTEEQISDKFGEGTQVAAFKNATEDGTTTTLNFETATEMAANVPYLIKPANAGVSYTFDGVTLVAADDLTAGEGDYKFVGNYNNGKQLSKGDFFIDANDNKFYRANGNETMKAFRATFVVPATSEAKVMNFTVNGGTITGIDNIDAANSAEAFDIYSINGVLIKKNATSLSGLAKGVYIVNGKKYIAE